MRLVISPVVFSISSISFTLTSFIMRFFTAEICSAVAGSSTGIRILVSGWRTLIDTLRRRASTIDETFCASDIISSRRASISRSSAVGNAARCTDSSLWRPLTALRSVKMRSEMNGANGAASIVTVSRQVYSV